MSTPVRLNTSHLESLPDRLDDTRYELIERELHVSTQPHRRHQMTYGRVYQALQNWSDQTGQGVAVPTPGVIFNPEDVDWREQTVQVYRREEAVLRLLVTLTAEDTLTSPLLPGFAVTVGEVCRAPF